MLNTEKLILHKRKVKFYKGTFSSTQYIKTGGKSRRSESSTEYKKHYLKLIYKYK